MHLEIIVFLYKQRYHFFFLFCKQIYLYISSYINILMDINCFYKEHVVLLFQDEISFYGRDTGYLRYEEIKYCTY